MPPDGMTGGAKLQAYLANLQARAGKPQMTRVGFLEGSTEADGTSTPMVAWIQEFGGRVEREPGEATINRALNATGTGYLRNGRFVKASHKSSVASTHYVGAYVITIPPRPFFRTMIAKHKGEWAGQLGKLLAAHDNDATKALALMGEVIAAELRQSIVDLTSPPLSPVTIARKGSTKPLIETGTMLAGVSHEVTDG